MWCTSTQLLGEYGKKKREGVNENSPNLLSKGNTTHSGPLRFVKAGHDSVSHRWGSYFLSCVVSARNLRFCSAWRLGSGLLFCWVVFNIEVLVWGEAVSDVLSVAVQCHQPLKHQCVSNVMLILNEKAHYHLWGRKLILSQLRQGHLQFTTISNLSSLWA